MGSAVTGWNETFPKNLVCARPCSNVTKSLPSDVGRVREHKSFAQSRVVSRWLLLTLECTDLWKMDEHSPDPSRPQEGKNPAGYRKPLHMPHFYVTMPSTGPRKVSGAKDFDLAHVEFQIIIHFQVGLSSRQVNREPGALET